MRLRQTDKCIDDDGGSAPKVTYLCTVYVLYGYYASATLISSVDFTKKRTSFYVTKSLSFVNKSNVRYIKEI